MVLSAMLAYGRNARTTGNRFGRLKVGKRDLLQVGISSSVVGLMPYIHTRESLIVLPETFWVDLAVRNPLDAEVNLSNLTLVVQDVNESQPFGESHSLVDVDIIEDVVLAPRESRTVSLFSLALQSTIYFDI
jgi:hypothetical protein